MHLTIYVALFYKAERVQRQNAYQSVVGEGFLARREIGHRTSSVVVVVVDSDAVLQCVRLSIVHIELPLDR